MATSKPPAALLNEIAIPVPCTESWDAMQGDERVRHCGLCRKNVYNLSAMPQAEAAALLAGNHDGSLCVRFYRRSDGTVMTSDCSASPRVMLRRAVRTLPGAAAGVAGAAAMALSVAHAAPVQKGRAQRIVEVKLVPQKPPVIAPEPLPEPMMMMGAPAAPAEPIPQPIRPAEPVRRSPELDAQPAASQAPAK